MANWRKATDELTESGKILQDLERVTAELKDTFPNIIP